MAETDLSMLVLKGLLIGTFVSEVKKTKEGDEYGGDDYLQLLGDFLYYWSYFNEEYDLSRIRIFDEFGLTEHVID